MGVLLCRSCGDVHRGRACVSRPLESGVDRQGLQVRVEADGTAVMEVLPPAARNGWIDFVMLMDYTLAPSNGICHILNFVNGNHFEYIRRRKYDIPPRTK